MKTVIAIASIAALGVALVGCDYTPSSDEAQRVQQERTKQSCMNAGGKWSEGIQYGRITQLCTYN